MNSDKIQLRKQLRQILAQMPAEIRARKSQQICRYLLSAEEYQNASVVMVFLSMPQEVDTTQILLDAWRQGKIVAVPRVCREKHDMIPVEIHSLDTGLSTDSKGLRSPVGGTPVSYKDIDMVIVPGLGFDRQGNRLGRGGAYYDRFFASCELQAKKWAIAFSEQIVDAIPHEENDIPVDVIVCETGLIRRMDNCPAAIKSKTKSKQ